MANPRLLLNNPVIPPFAQVPDEDPFNNGINPFAPNIVNHAYRTQQVIAVTIQKRILMENSYQYLMKIFLTELTKIPVGIMEKKYIFHEKLLTSWIVE
ncbi:hypothetical protein G9A89_008929 [Geosiphon pyriformis]|nr:hypothetical protein G9A89_008929 [Geosiphon pyriformis]